MRKKKKEKPETNKRDVKEGNESAVKRSIA